MKKENTPTKELFTIFEEEWAKHHTGRCLFGGADGAAAKRLWMQCRRECPDDPMTFFKSRVKTIMAEYGMTPYVANFRGLLSVWNQAAKPEKPKSWRD